MVNKGVYTFSEDTERCPACPLHHRLWEQMSKKYIIFKCYRQSACWLILHWRCQPHVHTENNIRQVPLRVWRTRTASKGDCGSIRLESGKGKKRHRPAGNILGLMRNWSLGINEDEIQKIFECETKTTEFAGGGGQEPVKSKPVRNYRC